MDFCRVDVHSNRPGSAVSHISKGENVIWSIGRDENEDKVGIGSNPALGQAQDSGN